MDDQSVIDPTVYNDDPNTTTRDTIRETQLYQDGDSESALETTDPLVSMRMSGAGAEDIVRGARQIYGDGLPEKALQEEEMKIYKRLYGEPASLSNQELEEQEEATMIGEESLNELLDEEGEPVQYVLADMRPGDTPLLGHETVAASDEMLSTDGETDVESSVRFPPSVLIEERAREVAGIVNGEVLDENYQEDQDEEDGEDNEEVGASFRSHPFTKLGKFATSPRTLFLPQEQFVKPVQVMMRNFSNKHLLEMCMKTFGGPGLPDSPLTPKSGRSRPQVAIPLTASQHIMGEMEANAFMTTIMPPTYAAIMSVLVETRKRLGPTWLNNLLAKEGGPRVLDVGSGGAGIIAWREVVKAHWKSQHSSDTDPIPPPPPTKSVVLTGSESLRTRAAILLHNTTFIPRMPDYVHTRDMPTLEDDRPAQQRKQFDVIIAPHTLFPINEDYLRKNQVLNLWSMLSPEGGVIIFIEKGIPRGFEAIGAARDLLLERYIAVPEGRTTEYSAIHNSPDNIHVPEKGMIIAPCTNHERCPMYKVPGFSKGRKDFCSVQQRYIRPPHLQRVLGGTDRNHDDVDFSYISVMRGQDLRSRQIQSWSGLDDALTAPEHPHPQRAAEDYASWTKLSQKGFEQVDQESTLADAPSLFTNAGKPPSTLPSADTLPRLVFAPMKRRGHVIMDVCTPQATIERWTVPRSISHQAYRDARKSRGGDLWALGAKTIIPRNLRLGGENTKEALKARGRDARLKQQAEDLLEKMHEEKMDEMEEMKEMEQEIREGRFLDEEIRRPQKSSRSAGLGKIKRDKPASGGVQSFTMNDFDMDKINPPMFVGFKKKKQQQQQQTSTQASDLGAGRLGGVRSSNPSEEDLTPEELSTLQEWNTILSGQEGSSVPITGGRAIRPYSKFAPRGMKDTPRKSGRRR